MSGSNESPQKSLLGNMRLYVLLTQAHCRIPILEAARRVVRGGADMVQLREKELNDREVLDLARRLRRMTEQADVGFIVNDRPDLARLAGADGVHLGQENLPVTAARKVLSPDQILGVSTHSIDQARRAVADGADYIGAGPIYPTATKGYAAGIGLEYLRAVAAETHLPIVAIGGITPRNVPEILSAGGKAHVVIAVCSAILGADDIEAATAEFKAAILAGE